MPQFDLATVLVLWIVGAVLMVPLAGLTARWALVPVLHAVARVRRPELEMDEAIDARMAGVEARLGALAALVERRP